MKNIHCMVFGHEFEVSRNVTYHVKEYACKNCKKQLTTSGNGNLIELTPKFKEINDVLERIHYKRILRIDKCKEAEKTRKSKLQIA
jgi:hydrogenase maturation factor HypF (carbamoyltransferase family)